MMLRGSRLLRAGVGAAAAASMASALHERRTVCLARNEPPPPEVTEAHRLVRAQLSQHEGVPTDEAMRPLQLALKGGQISARIALSDEAAVLPALLPFLSEFSELSWRAHSEASIIGESLVLQRPEAKGTEAASVCLFLPHRSSRSDRTRSFEASELELIGGTALSPREAGALAGSLAAVHKTSTRRHQQGQGRPPPGQGSRITFGDHDDLAGALGDLFGRRLGEAAPGGGGGRQAQQPAEDPIARLEALGVSVHQGTDSGQDDWDALAGGEQVRDALEESLLLPLRNPEVYREVMEGTRSTGRAPHAKAILFEGPPGTGKTSTARILAAQLGRPMVYLPLESVVSKWYGEAEQKLAAVRRADGVYNRRVTTV